MLGEFLPLQRFQRQVPGAQRFVGSASPPQGANFQPADKAAEIFSQQKG